MPVPPTPTLTPAAAATRTPPPAQVDALLGKVKDHVDDLGLTEEGFRRLYTVMPEFSVNDHHKKLETYLKITDNTKAARITVRAARARPPGRPARRGPPAHRRGSSGPSPARAARPRWRRATGRAATRRSTRSSTASTRTTTWC